MERNMPRLVQKPWFGPKRVFGWGWTPITWQGWLMVVVFLLAILLVAFLVPGIALKVIVEVILIGLLIGVCALTGTPPGGKF
jgi:hypothetical protein